MGCRGSGPQGSPPRWLLPFLLPLPCQSTWAALWHSQWQQRLPSIPPPAALDPPQTPSPRPLRRKEPTGRWPASRLAASRGCLPPSGRPLRSPRLWLRSGFRGYFPATRQRSLESSRFAAIERQVGPRSPRKDSRAGSSEELRNPRPRRSWWLSGNPRAPRTQAWRSGRLQSTEARCKAGPAPSACPRSA